MVVSCHVAQRTEPLSRRSSPKPVSLQNSVHLLKGGTNYTGLGPHSNNHQLRPGGQPYEGIFSTGFLLISLC